VKEQKRVIKKIGSLSPYANTASFMDMSGNKRQ
jgi:hypothetical protein